MITDEDERLLRGFAEEAVEEERKQKPVDGDKGQLGSYVAIGINNVLHVRCSRDSGCGIYPITCSKFNGAFWNSRVIHCYELIRDIVRACKRANKEEA